MNSEENPKLNKLLDLLMLLQKSSPDAQMEFQLMLQRLSKNSLEYLKEVISSGSVNTSKSIDESELDEIIERLMECLDKRLD